ncbi:radical SAM/SPASM domain-containing protein [Patescibacteria group bacterium]
MMLDQNTFVPQKIVNRTRLLFDFLLKKDKTKGLPLEIGIELTNKCNLACIMCPHQEIIKQNLRPLGMMKFALFKKIINEIKEFAELVYLHGMGEPLLNQKIIRFVKYAKSKNLRVALSTNATLLDKDISQKLIKANIDYIIFAVDGATKETYEYIRVGAKLRKVEENIHDFLKFKARSRYKPFVVIQFITMKANEKETNLFYHKWHKQKGINSVRVKPKIALKKLDKRNKNKAVPYCFHIFRQLNIFYDGTVMACCEDVHAMYPLGDVKTDKLVSIWNNKKMRFLKQINFQRQRHKVKICDNCNYPQPTKLQAVGTLLLDHLTVKKILPRFENKLKVGSR